MIVIGRVEPITVEWAGLTAGSNPTITTALKILL